MLHSRRRIIAGIVLTLLYALTWLGGPSKYRDDFAKQVAALHALGEQRNEEMLALAGRLGFIHDPVPLHLQPNAHVDWCFPVLPGIILADSSFTIGPSWGQGGCEFVIYYGWGTIELPVANWRA